MAKAILSGISKSNIINKNDIFVSNKHKAKLELINKEFGYYVTTNNGEIFEKAKDIIFLCVKPQIFDEISSELKDFVTKDQIIVSIMAGKSIDYLENALGTNKIVRVMPNTPALIGAGISAVATKEETKKLKNYKMILEILSVIGEKEEVPEKYINAITQISGASPAFMFMMIEALTDGGVLCGLPLDTAYKFAAHAMYGSGKLMVDKSLHPGVYKDMVISPAGTTIEGVKVLEEKCFRGAIIDAIDAAYKKSLKL